MTENQENIFIDDNQPAGGYIDSIEFNNGQTLSLNKNDIVIFVGPNNAGKSQSLKDIDNLYGENSGEPVVIKTISTKKSNKKKVLDLLNYISITHKRNDYTEYRGFGFSFDTYALTDYEKQYRFKYIKELFLTFLTTENRLRTADPAQVINRNEPKNHPIHYIAFDSECRKKVSDAFYKAFGKKIIPNKQHGKNIPLCMGDEIDSSILTDIKDESDRQDAYTDILEKYPTIELQGDGIRSFCGILLNLIIPHYRTFLIDEPESFLHPPQANIMGKIIGETLTNNQQAFISTHSQEIIKGLVDTCPERMKIVRITRNENTNNFSIINNDDFQAIWKDPLLKYSEIMSGIFYNYVVLCESDSDCKFYSIIYNEIKSEQNKYSDVLFIHCGGKQRLEKVIKALKSLGVSLVVVPDIDILNNEQTLKKTIENMGGEWKYNFAKDYKIISSNIDSTVKKIERSILKAEIEAVFNQSDSRYMSSSDLGKISGFFKIDSKWSEIKKYGEDAFDAGDSKNAYNRIKQQMNQLKIFPVPVGELECFVKEVGNHGPEWVNQVLEKYPDFSDKIYDAVKEFVKSWGI